MSGTLDSQTLFYPNDDETLPNFIKRKHPRKGEKRRNNGQGPKSRQANNPKEAGHNEVREPLSAETSTSRLKHINSRKGEVNPYNSKPKWIWESKGAFTPNVKSVLSENIGGILSGTQY
jgi:hypothetical protein